MVERDEYDKIWRFSSVPRPALGLDVLRGAIAQQMLIARDGTDPTSLLDIPGKLELDRTAAAR